MSKKAKVAKGLPDVCYGYMPSDPDQVTILKRGEIGYWPTEYKGGQDKAMELNKEMGVTKAQMSAMMAGSIFGFHVKAADPKLYGEDGETLPLAAVTEAKTELEKGSNGRWEE